MATIAIKPRLVFLDEPPSHDPGRVQLIFEKVGGEGSCGTLVTYENVNLLWEDRKNEFQLLDTADQDFGGRKWKRCLCLYPKVSQVFSPCSGPMNTPYFVPRNFQVTIPTDFCPVPYEELIGSGAPGEHVGDHYRVTNPRGKTYRLIPRPDLDDEPPDYGWCSHESQLLRDGFIYVDYFTYLDGVFLIKIWTLYITISNGIIDTRIDWLTSPLAGSGPGARYRGSFDSESATSSDPSVNPLFQPIELFFYENNASWSDEYGECIPSSPIILEAIA